MGDFEGFPADGPEFYAALEENNTREWWLEHKGDYESLIREPMAALLDELSEEFGAAKMFRPQRDIRFSKDKSPYKTSQGGFAASAEGIGHYLHLDAAGLMVGGGFHAHTPDQVTRLRDAVDAPVSGVELAGIIDELTSAGFRIEGEKLLRVPRGYPVDHPRAELLKHKSLTAGKMFGVPAWFSTAEALQNVRAEWRRLTPLVDWLNGHLSGD
ncbi:MULTISPECIES: DUF2461 domain-containing protein [Arthrobacter]|uniref:DUF2461 domain-containing protein n=2 Tax=Arthrobacter TaxID=1663 RepID=A0ABU9KLM2_9MICC|nr:DUF2461 domain-containing protein [Arthrobacter sp. YJM1]MDP5227795.1 DUF2461 domain-containing protein [Arthrobacter sp. YJM1]